MTQVAQFADALDFSNQSKSAAAAAGASNDQIDKIVQKMIDQNNISLDKAKELVKEI